MIPHRTAPATRSHSLSRTLAGLLVAAGQAAEPVSGKTHAPTGNCKITSLGAPPGKDHPRLPGRLRLNTGLSVVDSRLTLLLLRRDAISSTQRASYSV